VDAYRKGVDVGACAGTGVGGRGSSADSKGQRLQSGVCRLLGPGTPGPVESAAAATADQGTLPAGGGACAGLAAQSPHPHPARAGGGPAGSCPASFRSRLSGPGQGCGCDSNEPSAAAVGGGERRRACSPAQTTCQWLAACACIRAPLACASACHCCHSATECVPEWATDLALDWASRWGSGQSWGLHRAPYCTRVASTSSSDTGVSNFDILPSYWNKNLRCRGLAM
jgi:hypothetical protein